ARADLIAQGVEEGRIEDIVRVHLRYRGTDTALDVDWSNADLMRESFEVKHLQRFGFIQTGHDLEIEAVAVEAIGGGAEIRSEPRLAAQTLPPLPDTFTPMYSQGEWRETRIVRREELAIGHVLHGPTLLIEPNQTVVIEHGWQASLTERNDLVLTRQTTVETETVDTAA